MRFLVVGAGAVGCYVGSRLAADGNEVVFMEREPVRELLQVHGIRIESSVNPVSIDKPETFLSHEAAGFFDVVLVCVRNPDTESIIEAIRPLLSFDCALISLQSGIDAMHPLKEAFGEQHLMPGYARVALERRAPADVQELDPAPSIALGEFDGRESWRLDCVQIAFESAGFTATKSKDMVVDLWRNFLLEAALASISAQTGLSVPTLLETTEHRVRLYELLSQGVKIAAASGVALEDTPAGLLSSVEPGPDVIWLHMQRDLAARRPIENRALAGSLSNRARLLDIAAPEWRQLYERLENCAPRPDPGRDSAIPPVRTG